MIDFPKKCHCGNKIPRPTTERIRVYICPYCHSRHDEDTINAGRRIDDPASLIPHVLVMIAVVAVLVVVL